jgi:hypothetical protein
MEGTAALLPMNSRLQSVEASSSPPVTPLTSRPQAPRALGTRAEARRERSLSKFIG